MIELQRHIEILLLTNDCVIVPDLGGFMAHYVEARYDETDNTFVPPLRTIGFNQSLTMNDSLLVQSYIECYDISYPEALRRIEDEVAELRQHLQAEGEYELNDIGVLRLNAEGKLEFRPCEAGILTPGLYGLGTFQMMPLAAAQESAVEEDVVPLLAEEKQPVAADIEQPTDSSQEVDDNEEEHAIVIKMSWLRNAAAVAAAVVAFFMIGTPVSNSDLENGQQIQQSTFIPIATQGTTVGTRRVASELDAGGSTVGTQPVASEMDASGSTVGTRRVASEMDASGSTVGTRRVASEMDATTSPAEDSPAQDIAPATIQPQTTADEYCIVLASQVSQKNADGFVEQLNKQGFNEAYIQNKRFRRVLYGHYATQDEASEKLRELRKQSRKNFGEAWVMKSEK